MAVQESADPETRLAAITAGMPRATEDSHPELYSKVSSGLAALDGRREEPEVEETVEEEAAAGDVDAEAVADAEESSEATEAGDAGEAEADSDVSPVGETKEDAPTLPATHIRSLKAYGWTDAEIAEKTDEVGFETMKSFAAQIHLNRINETKHWAALGRQEREIPARAPQQAPGAARDPKAGLSRIDVDALKKQYEGDEVVGAIIEKIAGPVNETIAALNEMLPQVTASIERTRASELKSVANQLDAFFASPTLKPYAELYGDGFDTASQTQWENRNKVLTYADALTVGASRQGRSLPLIEALELAHDAVASGYKAAAIRNEIKTKVKQRSKSVSLRPSTKTTPAVAGRSRNASERELRAAANLAAVFGR